jgi:hypothetical protein
MSRGVKFTGPLKIRKSDNTLVTVIDEDGNIDGPITTAELATITVSSAVTTATDVRSLYVQQTQTAASASNQIEALNVTLNSNVQLGNWANAIMGKVDLKTAGYVTGTVGVICAELDFPGGTITGANGNYFAHQIEINQPTSFVSGGVPVGIFKINLWGAAIADFDTNGVLFDISGCTSGSGKFWYDTTSNAADEFIKVRTPGGIRYLILSDSVTFS